jgi:hypothetical protein
MAGSYGHVRPVSRPSSPGDDPHMGSWSLIENMGDAYECVEQLLWLTLELAQIIAIAHGDNDPTLELLDKIIQAELEAKFYPQANGEVPKDYVFKAVERVMSNGELSLDDASSRMAARRFGALSENKAEQKIRAIVRDEIAKSKK